MASNNDSPAFIDADAILAMQEKLGGINSDVKHLSNAIEEIKEMHKENSIVLAKNTADMSVHIQRTNMLQQLLEDHLCDAKNIRAEMEKNITASKSKIEKVESVAWTLTKILIGLGALVGFLASLKSLFGK